jgi:fumarate reductase flavoprotein subunit
LHAKTSRFTPAAARSRSGDFTNDPELKSRYMGPKKPKVEGVNVTATGDGQKLALPLGARIINGDLALGPESVSFHRLAPRWFAGCRPGGGAHDGMGDGSRSAGIAAPFIMGFLTTALAPSLACSNTAPCWSTEMDAASATSSTAPLWLPDQPDKFGYILIDAGSPDSRRGLTSSRLRRVSRTPMFPITAVGPMSAPKDPVLARSRKLGMDQRRCKPRLPNQSRSESATRAPLSEPPFVALGPVRSVFVHNEGGLAVDESHRVLGAHDRPIPGLYAAGATGQGGLLLKGHGHHLAWAFVSGRRAGRFAAQEATAAQRSRAPA